MMDTVKVWTVGSFEHVEAQPEWEVRISQRPQSIVLLTPLRGALVNLIRQLRITGFD